MSDMKGPNEWSDEEFIRYCEDHCRTPRALFAREHIERMAKLSGDKQIILTAEFLPGWIAAHPDSMMPLVEKARARLRDPRLRAPADVSTTLGPRLYSVTTIAKDFIHGGMRTPVICTTLERAKQIVESNEGDIWEYSYMLAVIEGVIPDRLYSASDESYWYCWNVDKGCYQPTECPPQYKNVFGFGIG